MNVRVFTGLVEGQPRRAGGYPAHPAGGGGHGQLRTSLHPLIQNSKEEMAEGRFSSVKIITAGNN